MPNNKSGVLINCRPIGSLEEEFPGATSWGVLGSVGGSWSKPGDWSCLSCGCKDQLLVMEKEKERFKGCVKCWLHGEQQLLIPGIRDELLKKAEVPSYANG